jgi:hypothetical protein
VRGVEPSVERPEPLELKTTRDDRDRARNLAPPGSGLDHHGVRPGIRNSTGDGSCTHHRRIAIPSPRSPERDRFLEFAGSLRDLLKHIGRDATWRIALAGVLAFVSTQVPLLIDTMLARGLLFVSAVTIGALVGRRLDRRQRRKAGMARTRALASAPSPRRLIEHGIADGAVDDLVGARARRGRCR